MYLSRLTINAGSDPTRERPGRAWLRNLYRVHQRLCMAFPSPAKIECDPEFLAPYDPEDFPEQRELAGSKKAEVDPKVLKQVHSPRTSESGFLFRIDPGRVGRAIILVQSAAKPNWLYAFQNARYLLAAEPESKEFKPRFGEGERLRFGLVANPTRRLSQHSLERDGKPVGEKWVKKRVPVANERLLDWLDEWRFRSDGCDEPSGFRISKECTTIQPGYIYVNKTRGGAGQRLFSVRYDGTLEVTHVEAFGNTLLRGIGPGKAFGFGLLSVAPCSTLQAAIS